MVSLKMSVAPPVGAKEVQTAIVPGQVYEGLSKDEVQMDIRQSALASEQFGIQFATMNHVRQPYAIV